MEDSRDSAFKCDISPIMSLTIYRVLCIRGGAGFLPSTVPLLALQLAISLFLIYDIFSTCTIEPIVAIAMFENIPDITVVFHF